MDIKNVLPKKLKMSKDKIAGRFKSMTSKRKAEVIIALGLTISILLANPVFSWLKMQRTIARYEKISSPNSLYISAARREDQINIKVGGIDVKAYWKDGDGESVERTTYQDYVFSVAGNFVNSYTLQLAHTTNNNYRYEIFEAAVSDINPSLSDSTKLLGRDYVEYTLTGDYDPILLAEISDNPVYDNIGVGDCLYYRVKKDDSGTHNVSLNGTNPTEANVNNVIASTYTVGGESVSYKGHYLNWASMFTAAPSGTYHTAGYGSYNTVNAHAEPLYWQVNGISGGDAVMREAFYHEYILRVSWTTDDIYAASATYKDTDMIYITVKAD